MKLSRELCKRDTGRTLYILDEPTTGLHFHDVKHLLDVLFTLRDHGNTIIVIEHNLDVIKMADWILDIGPEGGDGGGHLVVAGTPETTALCKNSHTGKFLAPYLTSQTTSA
jgi:excinuclease ABC subunit A